VLHANRAFAGTGGWANYATNRFSATLPAGTNTLTVVFDSVRGSGNWLNLDQLVVTPMSGPAPRITRLTPVGPSAWNLEWSAFPGGRYRVQQRDDWTLPWNDASGLMTVPSTNGTATGLVGGGDGRYFRVVQP
jgi:hypothetical protein